jgi:hypothetical protein
VHPIKNDMDKPTTYPDLADIYAQKAAARRARAQRSFGDKIVAIEQLRERLAPFKRAREEGLAAAGAPAAPVPNPISHRGGIA